jgi:hypothetical protein
MSFFRNNLNLIPGGLNHWFKLREGAGTTSQNSGSDGEILKLINTPSWTSGPNGGAITINGTNQYATFGNKTKIINDCTLSAWFRTPSSWRAGVIYPMIVTIKASDLEGIQLYTYDPNTSKKFSFICKAGTAGWGADYIQDTSACAVNTLYHITGTRLGNRMSIYVNGVFKNAMNGTKANVTYSATALNYIGAKAVMSSSQFGQGSIGDVKVYNRALSADEIWKLYGSSVAI